MKAVEPIRDRIHIQAMKDAFRNPRDRLLFTLGINTGLRISDLLSLQKADVITRTGLSAQPWRVAQSIILVERKTGKTREIALNQVARSALKEYLADHCPRETDYLFPSRIGVNKPLSRGRAWEILKEAAEQVGIEGIGTHTLRKTFGYHAYQQGIDLSLLQEIYQHSSPAITLHYIGITQDQIREVYHDLNL